MLNVLIVDDNPVEREFLRLLLEEIQDLKVIGEAEDGLQALDLVSTLNPHIVFLDINMPGVDGVEVVKQFSVMRSKAFIVFVTVESKYAAEAFELDTVDYLLKPFDRSRLRKTVIRVKERMVARAAIINQKKVQPFTRQLPKLFLRNEGDIIVINVPDIIFVEKGEDKRTVIHTVRGMYQTVQSINEVQQELAKYPNFVRAHKSYLINLEMVERITPWGDSSYMVKFYNYTKDALISRKNAQLVKQLFS